MSTANGPGRATDQFAGLRIERLNKSYGSNAVVKDLSLDVPKGTIVSLLGPSGCGKTTTLRMVAGLIEPDSGSIVVDGRVLSDDRAFMPPERRDMGMVFQSYALWPHMTVSENVGYGLRRRKVAKPELRARVDKVLSVVGMAGFGDRYPPQLSGGQQQRVAVSRALATEPSVLLFDEPLSNLDTVLREEMRYEIREIQRRIGITSVGAVEA